MNTPRPTAGIQHQDKARRAPYQTSPLAKVLDFKKPVARPTEGKPQSEIEQSENSACEAFIEKLRALSPEEFQHAYPALEAAISPQTIKDTAEDEVSLSEAKVNSKIESARAGEKTDLNDLDLKERAVFFDSYYEKRTSYEKERKKSQNIDNKDFVFYWIKREFQDREKWHMNQADLGKLDQEAWAKLQNWKRNNPLFAELKLPEKKNRVKTPPSPDVLTSKEIFSKLRRGEAVRPSMIRRSNRERSQTAALDRK